jgi:hypothetical protein
MKLREVEAEYTRKRYAHTKPRPPKRMPKLDQWSSAFFWQSISPLFSTHTHAPRAPPPVVYRREYDERMKRCKAREAELAAKQVGLHTTTFHHRLISWCSQHTNARHPGTVHEANLTPPGVACNQSDTRRE